MELPILTWTHSSCLMTIALEGSTVAMAMVMQISDIALVPSPPSPLFFSHLFVLALFSKRLLQLFFPLSPLCLPVCHLVSLPLLLWPLSPHPPAFLLTGCLSISFLTSFGYLYHPPHPPVSSPPPWPLVEWLGVQTVQFGPRPS